MRVCGFYNNTRLFFIFMGGVVMLFLIAPLVGMFISVKAPLLMETLRDQEVTSGIGRTLIVSAAATLISSIFAIPFAWILARKSFPLKGLVEALIDIPVMIPHSAAGIAVLGIISKDSLLGSMANSAGFNLVGSHFAIGFAMAFVSIPFLINSARDGFAAVPQRLESAAQTLGAPGMTIFTKVSLPLAKRSILSGYVLMFARGMSEFGAVVIVAYHPMTTPVMIFDRFNSFGLNYARPVAVIFIVVTLVVFALLRFYNRKKIE